MADWSDTEERTICAAYINVTASFGELNRYSFQFAVRLRDEVKALALDDSSAIIVEDLTYHHRDPKSIMNRINKRILCQIRKFVRTLENVRAHHPVGVFTEDQIRSMAIAKHLGKRKRTSNESKDFPHENWAYYEIWLMLKDHPSVSLNLKNRNQYASSQVRKSSKKKSKGSSGKKNHNLRVASSACTSTRKGGNQQEGEASFHREYKKRKLEHKERMLAVETESKTYQMAMEGYKLFRNDDPALAREFKGVLRKQSAALRRRRNEAPGVATAEEEEGEGSVVTVSPSDNATEEEAHHHASPVNEDRWSVDI